MVVMQKLKFMQEFTFAIKVECLHSYLVTEVLMNTCLGPIHTKTCKCHIQRFLLAQSSGKKGT